MSATRIALLGFLAGAVLLQPFGVSAGDDNEVGVIATFDGEAINLADGWGEATACASDSVGTRCYRTETEMDEIEAQLEGALDIVPLAACSTTVRLYTLTSYGGTVLQLSTRSTFLNLSAYGFDNLTSSYKIGACNSTFYDGASGSGSVYPGATTANSAATSMAAGWDNRVSSVYIA